MHPLPAGGSYDSLPYLGHEILLGIVEGHRNQIALLAHLHVIGDEVLADLVGEGLVPIHPPDQGIQLVGSVAEGIKAADQASHTGAEHHIHGDLLLFEILDDADVGDALGTAAAQYQRYGGTALLPAYLVHLFPHTGEHQGIDLGIGAGGGQAYALPAERPVALAGLLRTRPRAEEQQQNDAYVFQSDHK